jgi:hypothetical protein
MHKHLLTRTYFELTYRLVNYFGLYILKVNFYGLNMGQNIKFYERRGKKYIKVNPHE